MGGQADRDAKGMGPTWAWVALALWVGVIWGHSLVPAQGSDAESLAVVEVVRLPFEAFGVTDVGVMNHLVRKGGHFCEYLMLGLLATRALRPSFSRPLRRVVPTLGIGAAVPIIDETIQLFVPGRAGMVTDVALDMCGFACALALVGLARHLGRRSARSA